MFLEVEVQKVDRNSSVLHQHQGRVAYKADRLSLSQQKIEFLRSVKTIDFQECFEALPFTKTSIKHEFT